MINSLFIINTNESKIFMEKHWCAAVSSNFETAIIVVMKITIFLDQTRRNG